MVLYRPAGTFNGCRSIYSINNLSQWDKENQRIYLVSPFSDDILIENKITLAMQVR
jgi:hypothetical protein